MNCCPHARPFRHQRILDARLVVTAEDAACPVEGLLPRGESVMTHRKEPSRPACSDLTFRFGPAPLSGNDRSSLANALHAVSLNILPPAPEYREEHPHAALIS